MAFSDTIIGDGILSDHAVVITSAPPAFSTLYRCPDTFAEQKPFDLGLIDLLCAEGLPGAEGLNVHVCLRTLDEWAMHIRVETERHFYQFAKNPKQFRGSKAYYRASMLMQVLVQDMRVRYEPTLLEGKGDLLASPPMDSKHTFIHGLLGPGRTGTCANLPILVAAIGSRLGYPILLAHIPAHLFARWDDPATGERFNIEATEDQGFATPTDEEYIEKYRRSGAKARQREFDSGFYLGSLNARQSVAVCFGERGACLYTHRRWVEAGRAYSRAVYLDPRDACSSNISFDIGTRILQERPPRHPLALPGSDPEDLRHLLSPTDAAPFIAALGHQHELAGRAELARSCYREAVRLDPTDLCHREELLRFATSNQSTWR